MLRGPMLQQCTYCIAWMGQSAFCEDLAAPCGQGCPGLAPWKLGVGPSGGWGEAHNGALGPLRRAAGGTGQGGCRVAR